MTTMAIRDGGESPADVPLDPRACQAVQPVQPPGDQRQCHVQPVDDVAAEGVLEIDDVLDPHQGEAGHQHGDRHGEQDVADPDRSPVAAVVGVADVQAAEDDQRQNEHQTDHDVAQQHQEVEVCLVDLAGDPLHAGDRREVGGVGREQRDQDEDDPQEFPEARRDRADVELLRWIRCRGGRLLFVLRHRDETPG